MNSDDPGGSDLLHAGSAQRFPEGARTVFAPFATDSDHFKPSALPFMLKPVVDDPPAMPARALGEGVDWMQSMEKTDYRDRAWIMDPDRRKVELWQPLSRAPTTAPLYGNSLTKDMRAKGNRV